MNKIILIVVIVLIVGIGGYFLLKGDYRATAPKETPEAGAPAPISEVLEVTVEGTEFAFSPSTITAKSGQQVKINFENHGGLNHNLIIEGLGVSIRTIGGGKTDTVEFIAPSPGNYTITCSLPGHFEAGMKGTLVVE